MTVERSVMSCSEAVRQLWDYLDDAVSDDDHQRVDRHLSLCRTCCGELEFAKELRVFLASHAADEIPSPVRARLERFVADL
jgi:anti-sigma factor (TIGR02949 family)